MRKILLGTTAVVGAALLAPGAFAQTTQGGGGVVGQGVPLQTAPGTVGVAPTPLNVGPAAPNTQVTAAPTPAMAGAGGLTIRLGGYFAFTGAAVQDDWDRARSRNVGGVTNANSRSRYDFRNDAELNVFVDGRTNNGLTYGAVFELQMDNASVGAADGTTVSFDELYGYIGINGFGTFRFGQEDSAASLLQVRAPASQALGGDAEWDEFIVQTGLYSSAYLMSGINDGSDATKLIYLSPQFAGFDFGLSYAPNAYEGERTDIVNTTLSQRDRTNIENEMSVAVRYRGTFGPVGVIAGVGAMFASPASENNAGQAFGTTGNPQLRPQSVTAYTGGLVLTGYGFSIGGEYTFGQYSGGSVGRAALNPGLDDSNHYLLGATYTMGPLVFGAAFGQATQSNGVRNNGTAAAPIFVDLDDRKQTLWGVGVAYNLAPGLVLFGLYNNINDENVPTSAPTNARYPGVTTGTTLASFNGSNTRTINIGIVGVRLAF
jgi:predicted porin